MTNNSIRMILAPITSTVLLWIPFKEIFHLVRYPNWQSAITGTGRDSFCTIFGTELCHFRYGHSLGPVPKLGSMRGSHFRYRALPVPVRSFTGPRTGTGLYARGTISSTGLCQFRYGPFYGPVLELNYMRSGCACWCVCG